VALPATSVTTPAEQRRLDAVRRYDILDTPPDGAFDHVTALAARLFSVPIAIISLVDTDRIWFKSHHGLDVDQLDRSPGLCASAILGNAPYVVADALHDPRTLSNSLVAGAFGLRFYAAVPLHTHDGYNLGTLCVIDRQPRTISPADIATLEDLAAVVMDQMELRLSARSAIAGVSLALARAQLLAREIDHRVMNSLQLVVGMLNMQAQASGNPETASQLDVAAQRISSIARVHRHFYVDEAVVTTDALGYLRRLCRDFDDVIGSTTISVDGAPVTVATAKIMPLGIIVNELVTNAAKCGASHINLRIGPVEHGLQLCVSDNGTGLPAGFDPKARIGLGMRVVDMLIQQLDAALAFGPVEHARGTRFTITIPDATAG
jgi:two-component sensor histidine kinase